MVAADQFLGEVQSGWMSGTVSRKITLNGVLHIRGYGTALQLLPPVWIRSHAVIVNRSLHVACAIVSRLYKAND